MCCKSRPNWTTTLAASLAAWYRAEPSPEGSIIPQITDPFFPDVVQGVESVARAHGYNVFLCNTNEDPGIELEYVQLLASKQVDGFILCGSRLDAQHLSQVAAQYPVSILTSRKPSSAAVVSILGEEGLCQITSHLVRLGHRVVGHVGWGMKDEQERIQGYCRALTENGIQCNEQWVVRMPRVSIETGRDAGVQLLRQAPEITAVSCFNDLAAVGVLQACRALGRRVPHDVAVVGFDDIPLASLVIPSLTTMNVPRFELGQKVMELLLRVMNADGKHEERVIVQPRLVIRESCGAQS